MKPQFSIVSGMLAVVPRRMLPAVVVSIAFGALAGCASADQRAAKSPLACARQAVAQVPQEWSDDRKHCVVSGLMARQCSATEARFAGWGKEVRDLFGGGDASRADLAANARGRECARSANNDGDIMRCCEENQ